MKIRRKSSLKQLLCVTALVLLSGCGDTFSLSLEEKLLVSMLGVFEAPEGAEGNGEPRAMSFTLETVTLIAEDATEIELFEDDPTKFDIINRSQIIAEADMADYVGDSFPGIRIGFAADATVVGKIEDNLVVTLSQADLLHSEVFTVEKAKELRLNIKTLWKNIITIDEAAGTESAVAPSFTLEIKYD
jgi:hypothetical protein